MTTATDQHVDPLTAMLYPAYTRRCDHCNGFVVTTPAAKMQHLANSVQEPLATIARALADTAASMTGLQTAGMSAIPETPRKRGRHGHREHHHRHRGDDDFGCRDRDRERGDCHRDDCDCDDCRCRPCHRDECDCRCCVVNADLVVSARLREVRVVPITIENNRRREREIKLELSEFTTRGGSKTSVTGKLVTPKEFMLGACQEREAVIVIDVGGAASETPVPAKQGGEAAANTPESETERPDVDDCVVAYADLRVVGCDNRPIRIAVAILPLGCSSYEVDCSCGCC